MIRLNDRKQHVLLTAKKLFVENSFAATSIQDILNASKISKGTFYNYFSSKNECLIAILEHGRHETIIRRQELLIGQSKSNKKVLAEQISIRLQVNRDHNLLPIFEAIFHSGDKDLRAFAQKHHLAEISWLSARLINVYGEDASPYALDCAVIMSGIIQHMVHLWNTKIKEEINPQELAMYTLRRIDSIMIDMMKKNDRLLVDELLSNKEDVTHNIKVQLLSQLNEFKASLDDSSPNGKQYAEFIVDEIRIDNPRIFLLETVIRSFRQAFSDTPYESDAKELAAHVWRYMDTLRRDNLHS